MKHLSYILTLFFLLATFLSCARIGTPPGGPKDETPPKVKKSKPENYATNYNRKSVYIVFDEFITLKDAFTEFTISPPLETKPIPRTKGKGVVVDLKVSELDTTTYTLDFGQSIADLNEGNLLPNFQFVISIQSHIDSFSVSGTIVDAFNLLPDQEGIFIQLYQNLSDTAAISVIPDYIGRTNPSGEFTINHIRPGTYAVFALKDQNSNMLFDMATETIAFIDEPIYLYPDSFPAIPDTILKPEFSSDSIQEIEKPTVEGIPFTTTGDSLYISQTTEQSDSVDQTHTDSLEFMVYGYSVDMYSFLEAPAYNQYLLENSRPKTEMLELIFAEPSDRLPVLDLIIPDISGMWYYLEASKQNDTLMYWLADSNMVSQDTILFTLTYPKTDTTGKLVTSIDTLKLLSKEKPKVKEEKSPRKRGGLLGLGKKEEVMDTLPKPKPRLPYNTNINKSAHDLNAPIVIKPSVPVFDYKKQLMELVRMEDTIEVPVKFVLKYDSTDFRKSVIHSTLESYTSYKLKIHEGAFTDIYGRTIDSTIINFTTQRDDYYGSIELQMTGVQGPLVLQLLTEKEDLVKEIRLADNQKITFDYLKPAKYKLKVIYDDNDNGIWDTGKYLERIQPERVVYFPQIADVKSNWIVEYDWILE